MTIQLTKDLSKRLTRRLATAGKRAKLAAERAWLERHRDLLYVCAGPARLGAWSGRAKRCARGAAPRTCPDRVFSQEDR